MWGEEKLTFGSYRIQMPNDTGLIFKKFILTEKNVWEVERRSEHTNTREWICLRRRRRRWMVENSAEKTFKNCPSMRVRASERWDIVQILVTWWWIKYSKKQNLKILDALTCRLSLVFSIRVMIIFLCPPHHKINSSNVLFWWILNFSFRFLWILIIIYFFLSEQNTCSSDFCHNTSQTFSKLKEA